jgi:hypothetical protein
MLNARVAVVLFAACPKELHEQVDVSGGNLRCGYETRDRDNNKRGKYRGKHRNTLRNEEAGR